MSEQDVRITKHSRQRTKDRLGIKKKIAEKNAVKALNNGITHAMATGNLKRYLDKLYLSHKQGNNMRVYHRYVYIFHDTTLITIVPLPNNLQPIADKIQKAASSDDFV